MNRIIRPTLEDLIRSAGHTQIGVLRGGFALIVVVIAVLAALVRRPVHRLPRGLAVGALVSGAAYFGAYTFPSGWMYLPTGAVVIRFMQDFRRRDASLRPV